MNEGWRCPGCGRCYAPWKATCHHCPQGMTGASDTNSYALTPEAKERLKRAMQQARLGGTTGPYDAGKDRRGRR